MSDCIFCKIIQGEIPSYKVFENESVYAFLDITQVTKGHTLLIPKTHVKDVFEWTPALAHSLAEALPQLAKALQKAFPDMEGLNIVNNNREMAYQTVFHSHIHLIPRYSKEDGFKLHFKGQSLATEEMTAIAEAIQKEL